MRLYKLLADAIAGMVRYFKGLPSANDQPDEVHKAETTGDVRKITPVTLGDLVFGDIYIHIVVQTDLTLREEEFTPTGRVRKKRDKYTPDLLVIDTFDPTTGKHGVRFVDELGLLPLTRTNLHRVFRASDEARGTLEGIVRHQEIHEYINLIVATLTDTEETRLSVDGLFESLCEKDETAGEAYDRHFDDLEDDEGKTKP